MSGHNHYSWCTCAWCQNNSNDYSGHKNSNSRCFLSKCPKCHKEVYYIKHNGGSVWIDSPLGPPWYKHPCFDENFSKEKKRNSLAESYIIDFKKENGKENKNLKICVVKSVAVGYKKKFTDIIIEIGEDKVVEKLKLKSNAGYLVGKLCLWDIVANKICPIDEQNLSFIVLDRNKIIKDDNL